ncbi:hypothetical protein DTO012A7_707 [Penicillium roqueforti]|uniref:uncharacterized protein n=1 Tax=Penicillium roqueforti TaxID=5082 RepID=UPI00190C7B98|nr:uncharacterized protein LCP9604111_4257 [Penicillium roqueforti]KAF9249628.1 hypothetical protein LCP9604111_4257 [Penicillium roqueforti]KAI2720098.1 hypothetical protein CBS147318_3404 [Penicillium roqueforti]KAI3136228.1 hypothetical protein CBS147330_2858 [Penicillium roqueforti]KAI3172670.1 hypothetical protein DTO039G3_4238 [Penicillium roqueforti]KAI3247789.1 hypothetical protein DTO012A7_707 [Penicillium roqueforti]
MTNRATKTPAFQPGKYTAWLAKSLEDEARAKENTRYQAAMERQSETPFSTQMEHEGAFSDREEQLRSRHSSKALHKPDRETELVDSSPYRLYKPTTCANNRSPGEVKQGPFKGSSAREEQIEQCRQSESKAAKRLIKRKLADDIRILKSEVEDLKQMVIALQPLLPERRKRKRVSFQDNPI